MANEGDIRPFIRFVAEATEKTLDLYLWATSELPYQVPLLAQAESIDARSPIVLSGGSDDDQSGSGGDGDAIRLWAPTKIRKEKCDFIYWFVPKKTKNKKRKSLFAEINLRCSNYVNLYPKEISWKFNKMFLFMVEESSRGS